MALRLRRRGVQASRDKDKQQQASLEVGSPSESLPDGSSGTVLREGSSRALGLCERQSCAGCRQGLLNDYFGDDLGGSGFPHRHDVSDFKGLQSRPNLTLSKSSV